MVVLSNLETFSSFSNIKFISVTLKFIFIIIITIIVFYTTGRSRTVFNVFVFRFSRGSSDGASKNKSSTGAWETANAWWSGWTGTDVSTAGSKNAWRSACPGTVSATFFTNLQPFSFFFSLRTALGERNCVGITIPPLFILCSSVRRGIALIFKHFTGT